MDSRDWHEEHPHKEVRLTLVLKTSWDEEKGSGLVTFWMSDVSVMEGNYEIGNIKGGLDGSVWLFHEEYAPHGFSIKAADLWRAFVKAAEAGEIVDVLPNKEL